MAPIISVSTSSRSAPWDDLAQALEVVRTGLQIHKYMVLTLDQDASMAAQGRQLAYSNLVSTSDSGAAVPSLKRLLHKTLLDYTAGQAQAPEPLQLWLHRVAGSFSDIADAVLRVCLRTLGMPGNALASVLDDSPPATGAAPASLLQASSYSGQHGIVAEAHTDRGLLTVVWDSAPGLQVLSSAGIWQPVALAHNQVAVFAGETLEHATAGAIPAAVHRVLQTKVHSVPRVSLCYEQRPAPYSTIDLRSMPKFVPNKRSIHPLLVSHATALFEASHRSINQPPPAAAAAAGVDIVDAHGERELQHQEAGQRQEAAHGGSRRRPLPKENQAVPPPSQRARTSPATQPLDSAPLRGATSDPPEDHPQAEQPSSSRRQIVRIRDAQTGNIHSFDVDLQATVQRVLQAYGHLASMSGQCFRPVLDGEPLNPLMSIAECDIRQTEVIDAFIEQYGD